MSDISPRRQIPRIIFNFNDRCLNGCPFCFTPFDGQGVGTLEDWKRILSRAYEFSPKLISFSGCDPLFYEDFYELLGSAEKKCDWALDSSLIYLNRPQFDRIYPRLDLISTSIDDTPGMVRRQRYQQEKLEMFRGNFRYVLDRCPQLVVHTLYSRLNADGLSQIADYLIESGVSEWSLYQFWPFDFMNEKVLNEFVTPDDVFESAGMSLKTYCAGKLDFDYVRYSGRANGYFFVTSNGRAYTTLPGSVGSYAPLGSIFDDDVYENWQRLSCPDISDYILQLKLDREKKQGGKQHG